MSTPAVPAPSPAPAPPPPGSPAGPTAPAEGDRTSLVEIIAGIILGLTAIVTAFAAYQGALADGNSLEGYTESTQHLGDANFFYNASSSQFARDQQLFVAYATAANTPGQEEVAEYIQTTLMDDNLQAAVDWWLASDALTPFDADPENPYLDEAGAAADELQVAAEETFAEGARANEVGDQYELAGVILAITLFFAGIATLLRSPRITWSLLAISAVTLVGGAVLVASTYAGAT